MDELWRLIKGEADAIEKYYAFLEAPFSKTEKGAVIAEVAVKIISDKLDHMKALEALFAKFGEEKPEGKMAELASQRIAAYEESKRIIK